jgi:predicted N-acetyltransferase YhbS
MSPPRSCRYGYGHRVRGTDEDAVRIGLAVPADVEGCVRLAVDLLAHDPARRRAKLQEDLAAQRDAAEPGARALFVARIGDDVVGYGRLEYWTASPDGPATGAPQGWYLMGLLVDPMHRRTGIGHALTEARLDWLRPRTERAWYFANARNVGSLALHARLGFRQVTRDFEFPGVTFEGGVGVLCVADLDERAERASARVKA